MVLHDLLYNGKPDAASASGRISGSIRPEETVKDIGKILGRNAPSVIFDLDLDEIAHIKYPDVDETICFIHVFDRIAYYCIRLEIIVFICRYFCYTPLKTVLEDTDMPRYIVTLTNDEIQELKVLVQKGGKGYRIRHAQILLKLDQKPENKSWTYDRIKDAYGASHSTIAGIAKRFVMKGMEAALGRKKQENRRRKVTGDVEARICTIACSAPPEGASRWTMQAIADELIRLEVVDYITDTTVCEVMKKTRSNRGL